MRGSCVSSVENGNIWWYAVFSVASRAEALDKDEECPPWAARDWSYSSKFGRRNLLRYLP